MKIKTLFFSLLTIFSIGACSSPTPSFKNVVEHPIEAATKTGGTEKLIIKAVASKKDGDCTLVKLGDCELLVDCGGDADKIKEVLKKVEGDLDYVIITHQDGDHLDAFSAVIDWLNEEGKEGRIIKTLIDFDITKDSTVSSGGFVGKFPDTNLYPLGRPSRKYRDDRKELIKKGKIGAYYTASQCLYEQRGVDGEKIDKDIKKNNKKDAVISRPSPVFEMNSGGSIAELRILDNVFNYTNKKTIDKNTHSLIVNQMSVCSLITYGKDKFLFTGDLEEFDSSSGSSRPRVNGETYLIKNNSKYLKDGVMFYRGGHHGSDTSSSAYFCSVIRPQYVCWTGIAGNKKYRFPKQAAISNVGRWTDKIYYSMCDGSVRGGTGVQTLYGNTTFTYNPSNQKMSVDYEKPDDAQKEPDSFFLSSYMKKYTDEKNERMVPVYVYNLTTNTNPENPVDCSYVKIGHLDVLIGAGQFDSVKNSGNTAKMVKKIKTLCNDKVLDYVIIPSNRQDSFLYLIGKKGLFADKEIKVDMVYKAENSDKEGEQLIKSLEDNQITYKEIKSNQRYSVPIDDILGEAVKITFLNYDYASEDSLEKKSLVTLVSAFGFNYLNMGHNHSYSNEIFEKNADLIEKNIDAIQIPWYGYLEPNNNFYNFITKISISTNNSIHAYSGYASDKDNTESKDGMVALFNTTFGVDATGNLKFPSIPNFIQKGANIFTYKQNFNPKHLLTFATLYETSGNAKSYNGFANGDLCLRALCMTYEGRRNNTINYCVAPNFGKDGELLFNQSNSNSEAEQRADSALMMDDKKTIGRLRLS